MMSTQNLDITIHPYQPDQTTDILDLVRLSLGEAGNRRKTADFWQWKHTDNPFGPSYGLYAWAEAQQIAVGLRTLLRWHFQSPDGQPIQAVRAVDTATHPDFQRRGIFSKLTQQALAELTEAEMHLIFNTPNPRSLQGYLKLGWQIVEKWPMFIKPLKPLGLLKAISRRPTATPDQDLFQSTFQSGVLPWVAFVNRYRNQLPTFITNWEASRAQVGYRTSRNLPYLQWHYGQHPYILYGVCALEQAGALTGFAILRPNLRYGLKEVIITELFLQEPDRKIGQWLLKQLFKQLKGDYVVAHFAQGTLERQLITRSGFLKIPRQGRTFVVRPLNPVPDDPYSPRNWDLTIGDLEIF